LRIFECPQIKPEQGATGDPEDHLEEEVRIALREYVALASIGPIMSEAVRAEHLEPDIVPASPKMGALVYAAAEQSADVLRKKRGNASSA
jgi:hypothetical protein